MAKREITVLTDASLITCIVQRGVADTVVRAASEGGAQGATICFARGTGVRERLGILGLAVSVEKEIVNIIVANDQLDHIFEKIYLAAKLDTPGMGLLYVTPLEKMATYIPPDIEERFAPYFVRQPSCQKLEGDDPERVHIRTRVEIPGIAHLLGAHVYGRAEHLPRTREA